MKEKLERYYDYIVNDLLSTTKVDEENRTIKLPFPPYVKLNPYDGSDKPIAMIDIKDGIRLRGTNTGYMENMLDNYGLRDGGEVSDVRNRFHKLLVDKYTKFAEDYLNKVADDLLSKMKTNPSLPHYKPNQYLHNLTIFTNLTITSLFLFFHLITNLYIILLIIR